MTGLEEPLCRVEILKATTSEYVATIYSDFEGVKELRNPNLELLLRELTMDLEYNYGAESSRKGSFGASPSFEEEGVYPGEEMF